MRAFVLVSTVLFAAACPARATAEGWAPGFHAPGMNGNVYALATVEGDLVAGGTFTRSGGTPAIRVARWDGEAWHALGEGVDGPVHAVTVHDGEIVVGGAFSIAGGVAATNVAVWDGASWRALGSGIGGFGVYALAVWNGELIAGGWFEMAGGAPAANLARWDGTSWAPIGGGTGVAVYALAVHDGDLVAGGSFGTAGGQPIGFLARWDGASWSDMGSFDGRVTALEVTGGALHAGGDFTTAGGVGASRIARWNGSAWQPLGAGTNDRVQAIDVQGGRVYAGGRFTTAGGQTVDHRAYWDGSAWHGVGVIGTDGSVRAITSIGSDVYFGGTFYIAGGRRVNRIVREANTPVGDGLGLDLWVNALAVNDDRLFAAGDIGAAGATLVGNIARLDETGWTNISGSNGPIHDLVVHDGAVVAGGEFTSFGGVPGHNRVSRNLFGAAWQPVGEGFDDAVIALTVAGDDLYAGGRFSASGMAPRAHVARWDGAAWQDVGGGVSHTNPLVEPSVDVLGEYEGALIAGGFFDRAGPTPVSRIARWDGAGWSDLAGGVGSGAPLTFVVYEGVLVVGGTFETAGGLPLAYVASWDGATWSTLGGGVDGAVTGLGIFDGDLIACGTFDHAGGTPANGVARYDGVAWSALGPGVDDQPRDIAVLGENLYVGGFFSSAGGRPSNALARWIGGTTVGVGGDISAAAPLGRRWMRVRPNPMRGSGALVFELARPARVEAGLYDVRGRRVRTLVDARLGAGRHEHAFGGARGDALVPGVYFVRLEAAGRTVTEKIVLR